MFISDTTFSIGPPGFPGPGQSAWRMVERELEVPWYHVRWRIRDGGRSWPKWCMPADASVLEHLLSLRSPDHMIEEVQVVTAPHVNGTTSDRMETLTSLVVGYDQNRGRVLLHKVASGAVYSSAHNCLDVSLLTNTRTIYEDTKSAHSPVQECAEH